MAWTHDRKLRAALDGPRVRALFRPDTRIVVRPGWMSIVTPSAKTYLNEVTYAQLSDQECERTIDETVATYRALGIRTRWHVGPDSAPTDLGERLLRRGFARDDLRAMGVDTSTRLDAPADVEVVAVDESNLDDFIAVQLAGWSMPPSELEADRQSHLAALSARPCILHLFLARIDGQPIGSAAVVVRDEAYGLLMGGQVLSHAQRRGAYRALTAARLQLLRARGCEYAVTYGNERTSAPALERMGFETLFTSAAYTLQP